jgi:hypothetical protein
MFLSFFILYCLSLQTTINNYRNETTINDMCLDDGGMEWCAGPTGTLMARSP